MEQFNTHLPSIFYAQQNTLPPAEDDESWRKICARKDRKLHPILHSVSEPLLVIDKQGAVYAANPAAANLLGKSALDLEGNCLGEILGCRFSHLTDGCNHSHNCDDCTVRHLLRLTHETSVNFFWTIAYLYRLGEVVKMRLSTQRIADFVLLRFDQVVKDSPFLQ